MRRRDTLRASPLPWAHVACNDAKQRMSFGPGKLLQRAETLRIAHTQFFEQMVPFVQKLPASLGERVQHGARSCFPPVEPVTATFRFGEHDSEISVDCSSGIRMIAKSMKLRMMAITSRATRKHLLREERFAPQRDETFRIEVLGMDGPQAHEQRQRTNTDQRDGLPAAERAMTIARARNSPLKNP